MGKAKLTRSTTLAGNILKNVGINIVVFLIFTGLAQLFNFEPGPLTDILRLVFWILPAHFICLVLNHNQSEKIAGRSYEIFVGKPAQKPPTVQRLASELVKILYKLLLIAVYSIMALFFYVLPFGQVIVQVLFGFLAAFIVFEYGWVNKDYFEKRLLYFFGFALPISIFCFFFPIARYGGLAVLFPFYIVMANRSRPLESPHPIKIFYLANYLATFFVVCSTRGIKAATASQVKLYEIEGMQLPLLITIFLSLVSAGGVTSNSRSILVGGQPTLVMAGHVHYVRSTPQMWPDIMKKTKEAGLNAIDTYVFWNQHEQVRGTFDFAGNKDLRRFIKEAQNAGLYVILRVGPYVCAEFNFGGFPEWLKEIPGIALRTNNEPFKAEMERFVKYIYKYISDLEYSNGGPIIMMQMENEYQSVEAEYKDDGKAYINWAANLALSLTSNVQWFMSKQDDVPQVLNTCNGWYCDSWVQSRPLKSQMLGITELWAGWYKSWGEASPNRPAEDLAFSIARFIARGGKFIFTLGTYVGYYMWHGGTNFGRSAGTPLITTSYDYDAPLNEYGLPNEPKYSHSKALHAAINSVADTILANSPVELPGSSTTGVTVFGTGSGAVAFLSNLDTATQQSITYNGKSFPVPKWSVSIVKGTNEIFNTAKVTASANPASFNSIAYVSSAKTIPETKGIWDTSSAITFGTPREQFSTTHDKSDYLWYTTKVVIPKTSQVISVAIQSITDVYSIYLDDEVVAFDIQSDGKPQLKSINNNRFGIQDTTRTLKIVSTAFGIISTPKSNPEKYTGGITGSVKLNGVDIINNGWTMQVGLEGESKSIANSNFTSPPITSLKVPGWAWYQSSLPPINGKAAAYVLDLGSMSRGQVFINGINLGRYWNIVGTGNSSTSCDYAGIWTPDKCRANIGKPSQRYYHVPKEYLKSNDYNSLVLWEESGGDLSKVSLSTVGPLADGDIGTEFYCGLLRKATIDNGQIKVSEIMGFALRLFSKEVCNLKKYKEILWVFSGTRKSMSQEMKISSTWGHVFDASESIVDFTLQDINSVLCEYFSLENENITKDLKKKMENLIGHPKILYWFILSTNDYTFESVNALREKWDEIEKMAISEYYSQIEATIDSFGIDAIANIAASQTSKLLKGKVFEFLVALEIISPSDSTLWGYFRTEMRLFPILDWKPKIEIVGEIKNALDRNCIYVMIDPDHKNTKVDIIFYATLRETEKIDLHEPEKIVRVVCQATIQVKNSTQKARFSYDAMLKLETASKEISDYRFFISPKSKVEIKDKNYRESNCFWYDTNSFEELRFPLELCNPSNVETSLTALLEYAKTNNSDVAQNLKVFTDDSKKRKRAFESIDELYEALKIERNRDDDEIAIIKEAFVKEKIKLQDLMETGDLAITDGVLQKIGINQFGLRNSILAIIKSNQNS
ncbi:hypothetical protein HDV01_005278 [Terramyces sp. JEL0728]|nr:hypothetical protein HDV01_005278 [Terramyces sp. JEL0728]